ncbi:MAG: AmpG family muropeptide MFS transporter [Thermodesulfobacteriota bacterium]
MDARSRITVLQVMISRRMAVAFMMGFCCGLPLLLTIGVLQAWMQAGGVDLTWIGMITLVQLPYSWKFLWAPFLDRFAIPKLGRRRGWLLIAQLGLMAAIVALGCSDPVRSLWLTVIAAGLTAFFSATQDIVVDAYRREDLADEELGLGSSVYIYGYRMGMLLASGGGLILSDHVSFPTVYFIMAGCLLPGVAVTLLTPEPETASGSPRTLRAAVVDPLGEYFSRPNALWILGFIFLFKIGDTMAAAIATPFYLDIGFTRTQIGAVVKVFGTGATLAGALLGGVALLRFGIHRCLVVFGLFQALSTACFAVLAQTGAAVIPILAAVIGFENLSSGMGTAAYTAFMASITNKRFTATQYALLSSLMGLPRVVASAPTGWIAKQMGWGAFFIGCAVIAAPGLLMLLKIAPRPAGEPETTTRKWGKAVLP